MTILLAYDNDGVLRDESVSYERCVVETVAFFGNGVLATERELTGSREQINNDWVRTHAILQQRGINVDFKEVKEHFQDLYLGKGRDFTGYINDEPWLADNASLAELAEEYPLAIVSGAPIEEIRYTLKRNNALDLFGAIWGMSECDGKNDGLEQAIAHFGAQKVLFCDDRPAPLREASELKGKYDVELYGINPPNAPKGWGRVLSKAGAVKVYSNVREYCTDLLERRPSLL
jgi:HAD superfamily phosphatase